MRFISALVTVLAAVLVVVEPAFAETAGEAASSGGLGALGAGLGLGLAAAGGALGQGKVISGALDSIGRNPGAAGQMFLPWVLGLVFIEALVILTFIISLKLSGLI